MYLVRYLGTYTPTSYPGSLLVAAHSPSKEPGYGVTYLQAVENSLKQKNVLKFGIYIFYIQKQAEEKIRRMTEKENQRKNQVSII